MMPKNFPRQLYYYFCFYIYPRSRINKMIRAIIKSKNEEKKIVTTPMKLKIKRVFIFMS